VPAPPKEPSKAEIAQRRLDANAYLKSVKPSYDCSTFRHTSYGIATRIPEPGTAPRRAFAIDFAPKGAKYYLTRDEERFGELSYRDLEAMTYGYSIFVGPSCPSGIGLIARLRAPPDLTYPRAALG
jgi:hypothetical protein